MTADAEQVEWWSDIANERTDTMTLEATRAALDGALEPVTDRLDRISERLDRTIDALADISDTLDAIETNSR